jgi:ABC-type Mn2+/Zn2+ transport system permease subunit
MRVCSKSSKIRRLESTPITIADKQAVIYSLCSYFVLLTIAFCSLDIFIDSFDHEKARRVKGRERVARALCIFSLARSLVSNHTT